MSFFLLQGGWNEFWCLFIEEARKLSKANWACFFSLRPGLGSELLKKLFNKVFRINFFCVSIELEVVAVERDDVWQGGQVFGVSDEVLQFLVVLVVVEWNARDSIVDLVPEGVSGVVDDEHLVQVTLAQDSQVLYVHSFLSLHTMVSEETVRDELVSRVQVVKDHGGIA